MIFWFCSIFISVLLLLYLGAWLLGFSKNIKEENYNTVYDISLIIPFRNEAKNLPKLLESIAKLSSKPKEIIFINDHSEDKSEAILQKAALSIDILYLEIGVFGKKQALHKGILHAHSKYILTWDADIEIPQNYFEVLQKQQTTEFLILPVKMQTSSFLGFFASLDYYFLNAISFASGKFSQNLVASGANLLFTKKLYLAFFESQKSFDYSSGDDAFFLKFAKENKASIRTVLDSDLSVTTESPNSFKNFLQQRLRWIGKTKAVGDKFALLAGLIGLLYQLSFVALLCIYFSSWELILIAKIAIEMLIFLPYLVKIKHVISLFFSPIFSLIYPFYIVLVGFVSLFVKVEWKGRNVINK